MNPAATSKEDLLAAAGQIAREEGLAAVNVRRVAALCGVAVGSLYNYYPTKADLILAVVEDFWRSAFHDADWPAENGFPQFAVWEYRRLREHLAAFRQGFMEEILALGPMGREKGKALESVYFGHVREGMLLALEKDNQVAPAVWTPAFTRDAFVNAVFRQMVAMLRDGEDDLSFFEAALRRLLYER